MVAALAVMMAAIYSGVLFSRGLTFIGWSDNTVQYHPWMAYLVACWKHGKPPLWDFSTYSGQSFVGELQTGVFYPVNILFAWLARTANPYALDLLLLGHMLFAAAGVGALLRRMGLGVCAALLGGAVFAFGGPVSARAGGQANLFAGLCHLPWALFFIHRAVSAGGFRKGAFDAALAGVFLGFSLLAGHPQPFIHGTVLLVVWAAITRREERLQTVFLLVGAAGAFASLVSFIQIAASVEYFRQADRWISLPNPVSALETVPYEAYTLNVLKPAELTFLFKPTFLSDTGITALPLTALALAVAGAVFSRGRIKRLGLGLFVFGVLVALGDATFMGRLIYHTPWLNKVREPVRALLFYQLGVALLAALGLDFLLRKTKRPAVWAAVILAAFTAETRFVARDALAKTDDPRSAQLYNRPTPAVKLLEKLSAERGGLYRVMVRPEKLLTPNMGELFPVKTILGHRSSMNAAYYDFLAKDWSLEGTVLDDLGAAFLATHAPNAGFRELGRFGAVILYERPNAKPILRAEAGKNWIAPASVQWGVNQLDAAFDSVPDGSRMILAQTCYPGWKARVNGHRAQPGKKALFLNVKLPPGKANVTLRYSPWWLYPGFAAWALAAAGLAALWALSHGMSRASISRAAAGEKLALMKSAQQLL